MSHPEPAPLSVWRPLSLDTFLMGVPHYPEHVDESYWERDAARMAEAGFNVVRMGEFAWHLFEPSEGVFDFTLFDKAIAGLGRAGVKTILCTPTATPPRWLTANYPEVLRVDAQGRTASHGSRQHADTAGFAYRAHSRRITRALATHYRDNPDVIGWQTDNELNTTTSESYSDATLLAFQTFLRARYKTIAALNRAWGGDFWATAYDHFDQVVLPLPAAPGYVSPGHAQDFHRFLAAATAAFQREQVEILRAANPDWFVFHNVGRLSDLDLRGAFAEDLDFLGYDVYPMLHDEQRRLGGHAYVQALQLDAFRAYSGNFIVPEQASGFGSQPGFSTMTPEPGEMRRMAMSSVARGADGLMFFRWRPAHFGAEIYWMGIIDHDDVPRRRYAEAAQFAGDMARIGDALLGTVVRMDVGIAGADFDNQEAHKTYPMGLPSPEDDAVLLHRHCYDQGIACGFIHPADDLDRLKLLYVPHWVMWKPEWNGAVERFVRRGGTLVLGALTGTRDEHNHVIRRPAPGDGLAALAGVRVAEFGRLAPPGGDGLFQREGVAPGLHAPAHSRPAESAERAYHLRLGNRDLRAAHLYEALELDPGTEALARWSDRHLDGTPAVTLRAVGRGRVVYVGTYLTADLADALSGALFTQAGIAPLVPDLPPGLEVSLREAPGRALLFVQNTRDTDADVAVPPGIDLLTGERSAGRIALGGYGCAVIGLDGAP
jgi:beta-galactosidase